MKIREFLEKSGTKIIISDSVREGNALIRGCNEKDSVISVDTAVMTPFMIAEELVTAYESAIGNKTVPKVLSGAGAVYAFDDVLTENRPEFIPERSLTLETSASIYRDISIIRSFDKTEAYESSKDERITGTAGLIKTFEERLSGERVFDKPAVFQKAVSILNDLKEGKTAFPLSFYLPWEEDCSFADLKTNKRKGLEDKLITLFFEVVEAEPSMIDVLAYENIEDSKKSGKVAWSSFTAYGQHNEVKFIARKIKEAVGEGKHSFDQFSLFYTSQDYENYVDGIFDHYGIPCCFHNCYHAMNSDYVRMLLDILAFAEGGYRFEDLKPLVTSEIFTFKGICRDTKGISPHTALRKMSGEKIGWGRSRYEDYLNDPGTIKDMENAAAYIAGHDGKKRSREDLPEELLEEIVEEEALETYDEEGNKTAEETSEEKERIASLNRGFFDLFLKELLEVFDEEQSLAVTYEKLLKLAGRYAYKGNREKNAERKDLLEKLKEQTQVFRFVSGKRCSDISEKTGCIRDFLENLTFSKRTGPIAVNIYKLSGFEIPDRPFNFFIGMGAGQFALNTTESAVISDDEMRAFLTGPNIPLAGERNEIRHEQFKDMLLSLPEGSIMLGYSTYDSVELKDRAPSVMFMELTEGKEPEGPVSYDPFDEEVLIGSDAYREWIGEIKRKEGPAEKGSDTDEEKKKEKAAMMSASSLQDLMQCPLKYYYKYIRNLWVPRVRELSGSEWLPPLDKGNFFHRVFQHYLEKVMPPVGTLKDELDRAVFDKVLEEELEKIGKEVPWASDVVRDKEILEYKEAMEAYLSGLHRDWKKDADDGKEWWILGCELDFTEDDNLIYKDDGSVQEDDNEYPFRIQFKKGQIDRLDGYVDAGGCLNLRIIDYKTGRKEKKEEEITNCTEIQHYVYAMAAFHYIRKLRSGTAKVNGKNIFETYPGIKNVKIAEAAYEFPFEEGEDSKLSVIQAMENYLTKDEQDPFVWKVGFPDLVRKRLRLTEGYRQNDKIDMIAGNIERNLSPESKWGKTKKEEEEAIWSCNCGYCDFKKICRTKCGIDKLSKEEDDE